MDADGGSQGGGKAKKGGKSKFRSVSSEIKRVSRRRDADLHHFARSAIDSLALKEQQAKAAASGGGWALPPG
jgi:hypothetical protein